MSEDISEIEKQVLEIIRESETKITITDLNKKKLCCQKTDKKKIKIAVKNLLKNGSLEYSYVFGNSFLTESYNRPVRVSKHIVLKPCEKYFNARTDDIVISLLQGASFGSGEHPTTRLSLTAMEYALMYRKLLKGTNNTKALDIGTGTGVLAIASILMGIEKAVGIDIDLCSINEAKKNTAINNLSDKIVIDNRVIEKIEDKFSFIMANLRYPTLMSICPQISRITDDKGVLVFSGFKDNEMLDIKKRYLNSGFSFVWGKCEKKWGVVVFFRSN